MVIFGSPRFRIVVSRLDRDAPPSLHEQVQVRLVGDGWSLGSDEPETVSVLADLLSRFRQDSRARHWAAFVGASTYRDVIDRVCYLGYDCSHAHAIGGEGFDAWHGPDIADAILSYDLSSCFGYSHLGVHRAVGIRDREFERIVWLVDPGLEPWVAEIPIQDFDDTVDAFVKWATSEVRQH